MLVTIIDFETTGLDPAANQVAEVGAILFETNHREILQEVATVLPIEDNPAAAINGLFPFIGQSLPAFPLRAIMALEGMISSSEYLVAYNSDFDRQWLHKCGFPSLPHFPPWADAMVMRWPRPCPRRDLISVAVAHHIPVINAHRSLGDCRLVAELLRRVSDIDQEIARASMPKRLYRAMVEYESNDAARAAGFRWDPQLRGWFCRCLPDMVERLPFEVQEVIP
jgi:DNA polymerase III subunit epsilon